MARSLISMVFLLISKLPLLTGGSFDPFMDQTMFMIDWKGPLLEPLGQEAADKVVVMTKDKEQYQCIMPEVYDKKHQDGADGYDGPTATKLMRRLFEQTSCSYRLESYWTYELCHGKHLRQYHEVKEQGKKPKVQEYFLGFGGSNTNTPDTDTDGGSSETAKDADSKESNIKHRRIDGVNLPYYEVVMKDGTPCDLTQQPRMTRVMYVCQPDGHGEVYELKETSTCEYEVMVLTAVLCSHPMFRPKNPPVNKINCHALSGAPLKPQTLETWEQESKRLMSTQQQVLFGTPDTEADPEVEQDQPVPPRVPKVYRTGTKSTPVPDTSTEINKLTDKQLIRDLLSGDYCLQGGVGWWRHEVCIGRYARQFHKDKTGETSVSLGYFDETAHLKWLTDHPNKKPKALGQRKYLNYMYTGGDVCDVTGTKRKVEVRLKCTPNSNNPHGVSLFLSEPAVCEYVLVVESAMLCDLMDQADENALLTKIDL